METIKFIKKETANPINEKLNEAIEKAVKTKNNIIKTNKIVTK